MKIRLSLIAIIIATMVPVAAQADGSFLSKYERGPMPKIKAPKVRTLRLANGAVCYLMEDHTLPVVRIGAFARGGSILDPADKVGLAELTAMAMRSAGTKDMTPGQFDEAVDALGASVSASAGAESIGSYAAFLSADVEEGVRLFADMMFRPRFDVSRVAVAKLKFAEDLRREKDDPSTYADILYRQEVYGKDNIWARRADGESLAKISIDDIKSFHDEHLMRGDMIFFAAGDVDARRLVDLLDKYSEGFKYAKAEIENPNTVKLTFEPRFEKVKGAQSQAFIRMGHLGLKRHNPDWFAVVILNEIMGAANFKSRLMEDIRTKRGLAYGISGAIGQGTEYGLFTVRLSTSQTTADEAMRLVKEHIARLASGNDVTDGEVELAKMSRMSSAIFDIDSASKIVTGRAQFDFYGYPSDYWKVAYDGLARVKTSDVNRVAKKYLHPDGLKVLELSPKGR